MPDSKKVIKGLECCLKIVEPSYCNTCEDCPYKDPNVDICCLCIDKMKSDALILLKNYEVLEKQHEIQRTGKWIEEEPNCYTKRTYCSLCKEPAPFIAVGGDYYGRNMHGETKKTKYCPSCGARMIQ